MKLGTYSKVNDGFSIELIPGTCEYALGTTESHMFTLRMGGEDEGLIMFLTIDDMQDFSHQLKKCVDKIKMEVIQEYFRNTLGNTEFEF